MGATSGQGGMASKMKRAGDIRIEQAAHQYSVATEIHADLPPACVRWGQEYIEKPMTGLWGAHSTEDFYTGAVLRELDARPGVPLRILSIGCGECFIELEMCRRLATAGHEGIHFTCVDIAEGAVQRAAAEAEASGIDRFFDFEIGLYDDYVTRPWDVVIANQFLHHVVGLEGLFDAIKASIGTTGIFLTNDMIGRNGHMLWPEALAIVDRLWAVLPDRYKLNHVLGRVEAVYSNWDNSKEANEGIRAQDILPVLIERFHFEQFFAAGNIAVAVLSRHFGANFDPEIPEDRAWIDRIGRMDDDLIDAGYLKPVILYACLSNRPGRSEIYRHRTPEFCVRREPPLLALAHSVGVGPGEEIQFEQRAPAIDMLGAGWSSAEQGGVWSNDDESEVHLRFNRRLARGPCVLEVTGMQFLPEGEASPIAFSVNGVPAGSLSFPSQREGAVRVAVAFHSPAATDGFSLRFRYDRCWMPEELGMGSDRRRLAFRLVSLRLSETTGPTDT